MAIESSLKLLEYIYKVSKEPVILNGEVLLPTPVTKVVLKHSFFYHDDCQMCGRCCINETNAWTEEGINRINKSCEEDFIKWELDYGNVEKLKSRLIEKTSVINGNEIKFYISPKDKEKEAFVLGWPDRNPCTRCHWLFEKEGTYRCGIHPVRSVTCGMPHCRFNYNSKSTSTSIGLAQYGRNWALKCPVHLDPQPANEEELGRRIWWLERLDRVADDFKINTYLPEILHYLQSEGREEKVFELNTRRKLFEV